MHTYMHTTRADIDISVPSTPHFGGPVPPAIPWTWRKPTNRYPVYLYHSV